MSFWFAEARLVAEFVPLALDAVEERVVLVLDDVEELAPLDDSEGSDPPGAIAVDKMTSTAFSASPYTGAAI